MEEDIKILEQYISEWDECLKDSNVGNLEAWKEVKKQIKVNQAIKNLIARNKELEKHYEHKQEYINGEVFSAKQMYFIDDEYIPKSKIEEKIEWLEKISDNGMNAVRFAATHEDEIERKERQKNISTMIKILEELLEENKNE